MISVGARIFGKQMTPYLFIKEAVVGGRAYVFVFAL